MPLHKHKAFTGGNKVNRREVDDAAQFYPTPPESVYALMGAVALPSLILEPCCGSGNISKTLIEHDREVYSFDLVDRGYPGLLDTGDFLALLPGDGGEPNTYEAVVMNPPFSLAAEFATQALTVAPLVCMLARLNFMEGGQKNPVRDRILDKSGLAQVLVFRERLPMMHKGGEAYDGKRSTSQSTYAWFVFKRGFRGKPRILRISWKNPKPALPPPSLVKHTKARCRDTIELFQGDLVLMDRIRKPKERV